MCTCTCIRDISHSAVCAHTSAALCLAVVTNRSALSSWLKDSVIKLTACAATHTHARTRPHFIAHIFTRTHTEGVSSAEGHLWSLTPLGTYTCSLLIVLPVFLSHKTPDAHTHAAYIVDNPSTLLEDTMQWLSLWPHLWVISLHPPPPLSCYYLLTAGPVSSLFTHTRWTVSSIWAERQGCEWDPNVPVRLKLDDSFTVASHTHSHTHTQKGVASRTRTSLNT